MRTLSTGPGRRIALTTADRNAIADSAPRAPPCPPAPPPPSTPCTPTPTPNRGPSWPASTRARWGRSGCPPPNVAGKAAGREAPGLHAARAERGSIARAPAAARSSSTRRTWRQSVPRRAPTENSTPPPRTEEKALGELNPCRACPVSSRARNPAWPQRHRLLLPAPTPRPSDTRPPARRRRRRRTASTRPPRTTRPVRRPGPDSSSAAAASSPPVRPLPRQQGQDRRRRRPRPRHHRRRDRVVATRLVRPLRALTDAAQQPPERHARVPVTTKDEIGIPRRGLQRSTERREQLEAQRKAMVSDIAHELRTPLTNIRGWLGSPATGSSTRTRNSSPPCTRRRCCSSTSSTTCRTSRPPTPAP